MQMNKKWKEKMKRTIINNYYKLMKTSSWKQKISILAQEKDKRCVWNHKFLLVMKLLVLTSHESSCLHFLQAFCFACRLIHWPRNSHLNFNAHYQIVDNFKSKMTEEEKNTIVIKLFNENFPQLMQTCPKSWSLQQWSLS
jgi:RNase P subunit RPR2